MKKRGYLVPCHGGAFPLNFRAMKADPSPPMPILTQTPSPTPIPESPLPARDALWQGMLDQIPASIFVKDREGRYLLINRACEDLLGIPSERILGKTTQEVLPPELANQFLANDRRVLATEAPQWVEEILPQADGLHTLESLQFPLRDAQGDCYAIGGISIDITAQKRADISAGKDVEEQLRQSEERARRQLAEIQAYYDTAPVGLFALDSDLRYLRINERMAAVNGIPAAAHIGRTLREMAPFVADSAEPRFRQVLASGEPLLDVEHREPTPDRPGVARVWRESTYPVRNAAGQVIGLSGVVEEITDLRHAEEQWRASEALARQRMAEIQAYYDTAPIGLCVLDRDLQFLRINERLAAINGLSVAAHLGRRVREALPSLADTVEPLFQRILATGEPLLNLEIAGETAAQPGVTRVWRENFYPLQDDAGQISGINITVEEITALKQAEQQLRESEQRYRELSAALELKVQERTLELRNANAELNRLATTDGLTGVWNRRYLEQVVAGELARARRYDEPLALVIFDIDHFKSINDRHGHLVGDQVLIELAERVRHQLRASDVLARWGGEEFVVLMPHCTAQAAASLAEKLRLALTAQPFPTAGTITTSFGVAEYQPSETPDDWFTRADNALYAAKEGGRNRVVIVA